ncbi:alpha/beta fold hydrolase [Lentilactobacillus sp. SPB1-3]|uniref:Alpha/beta fold hydrolase n=1 Tax=Lentilactobacillus terminaliae TaxID=3003483 RepID=A0ACD5DHL4_9LACO|nr:alpha/beta hydrolase [Lentilactobacillus sp. SPB1-3]
MTNDRVQIDYTDTGEGRAVVLLSGLGGFKEIWTAQIPFLVENGFRVINIDARNQGRSGKTIKGRRISKHAQDIHDLLDALNIHKFIAVGNSMGASTWFAYISLYDCDEIEKVVDVDQSPKMVTDETWPFGFKDLSWNNFPEYLRLPFGPASFHKLDDQVFAQVGTAQEQTNYDEQQNEPFLRDHAFQDWRDVIALMKVPLLIVAGKNSPYFNPEFAKATANLAKYGEYKVVSEAGHLVMAEQPREFNQIILKFLKK